MEADNEVRHRMYSYWRKPQSAGIGQLSTVTTFFLVGGALVVVLVHLLSNIGVALCVAVLDVLLIFLMSRKDKHGRSLMMRAANRLAWKRAVRRKTNIYRSGPLGFTPHGRNQLPGIGSLVELSEQQDSWGRPFALLHIPFRGHFTIIFAGEPDGGALVDQSQVDVWVAHWGEWLATISNEPGVVAASVTVESAPDFGTRLRTEVESNLDPDAPTLASTVLREIVSSYPRNSATLKAFVAVTFTSQTREGGKKRTVDEVARDLGSKIGFMGQRLGHAGAGAVRPLTSQEVCEVIRVAYDPGVAAVLAEARANGEAADICWENVGPVGADTGWDYYRHDSGISRTWQMTQAPRGAVYSNVLQRLLEPSPMIARKRITLAYRPIDPARAAGIVERDRKDTNIRLTSTQQPTFQVQTEKMAADATAAEEARGAGLVNFGMYATATVLDRADLADASAAIENLAAGARLFLRPVTGSQDSAFAAALPIGLVLPEYQMLPTAILKGV